MKYLKKFNESSVADELKEFCEEYLAYLIDDGFSINTTDRALTIFNNEFFKYSDIKDHFIPFINILSENYKIASTNPIRLSPKKGGSIFYTIEKINDDKVNDIFLLGIYVYLS